MSRMAREEHCKITKHAAGQCGPSRPSIRHAPSLPYFIICKRSIQRQSALLCYPQVTLKQLYEDSIKSLLSCYQAYRTKRELGGVPRGECALLRQGTDAQHLPLSLSLPPPSVTPLLRRQLAGGPRGEGALLRHGVMLDDISQALPVSHGIQCRLK